MKIQFLYCKLYHFVEALVLTTQQIYVQDVHVRKTGVIHIRTIPTQILTLILLIMKLQQSFQNQLF